MILRIEKSKLDYILVGILLLASSRASTLFSSDFSVLFFTVVMGILVLNKTKLSFWFLLSTILFVAICLIHFVYFRTANLGPLIRMVTAFFYGYWVVVFVGRKIYFILSDIIARLALISLPLFLLLLLDYNLLYNIFNTLELLLPIPETRGGGGADLNYANFFIYTVWQPGRNHGFMWEPGAFAAILSIGIFFNLIRYQFQSNWQLAVMVICVITTLSTTGFILLFFLGFYYLLNKRMYWVLPVAGVIVILILQLEFLGPKIQHQIVNRAVMGETEKHYKRYGSRSLGRFGSMVADLNDLEQNYLFGIGHNYHLKYTGTYILLGRSNGLTDYLLKFGILGMVFFVFNLARSSLLFSRESKAQLFWFFPFLICILSFSNPVLFTPLFLSFQSYHFNFN